MIRPVWYPMLTRAPWPGSPGRAMTITGWKPPNEPVRAFRGRRAAGIADALSKVDCLATDATACAFGRLFGAHGSFQTALTIILTLYIALLAFNLLTGRSALGFRC